MFYNSISFVNSIYKFFINSISFVTIVITQILICDKGTNLKEIVIRQWQSMIMLPYHEMFIRDVSPVFVVRQRSWWDTVPSGGNKNIWRRNCVRNPNFPSRYNEHSLIENLEKAVPRLWLNLKFFVCLPFTLLFFFDNLRWCTINKFPLFTRQKHRCTGFHGLLSLFKLKC